MREALRGNEVDFPSLLGLRHESLDAAQDSFLLLVERAATYVVEILTHPLEAFVDLMVVIFLLLWRE